MFAIVVPGKIGVEADGVENIDVRNEKGERVGAFDLEQSAGSEATDADRV